MFKYFDIPIINILQIRGYEHQRQFIVKVLDEF